MTKQGTCKMLKKMKRMYPHQTLMMMFIIGLMTIAGSLVVQYVFKVQPCEMCYIQRYLAIAITVVAFIGTLFRGRIKKWFLATIALLAAASLTVGAWQSLAQRGLVELPGFCETAEQEIVVTTEAQAVEKSAELMANLQADNTGYVDCSKIEDFFVYNYTGLSLANLNVILMLFIGGFSFYKLFFKPRKRFRRYNNRRNNNRGGNKQGGNNRRYRGSGYRRSNNRGGNNRRYNNKRNDNN
tara:strand:+ start:563 stop:1282 length:720 start_codon:yes stop_codon:yes gene_type:complete